MIQVEIVATVALCGERCWRSDTCSYLFCDRGPRLLGSGIKWAEGKRARLDVTRRPIKGGTKVVVADVRDAEVNGRSLRGSGMRSAVSYGLVRLLREHGLLGKTLYVRMKALPK